MTDSSSVVAAEEIGKTYAGHVALRSATFNIERGECFALLGPNGSGKTTLLRILTDILKSDTGSVSILGASDIATVKDRVGYLPEERGLYKKQKVIDTLTYFGELKGLKTADARRRAAEVLESVGMAEHAQAKAETLSKGMAQRVQFAGAIVHDPEFVIFDEPFSGLDPVSANEMQDLLLAEKSRGRTLLLSTHQMQPVERLCDRLLMLRKGETMLYGSLADIRSRYESKAVIVEHEGALPSLPDIDREPISEGKTRLKPRTDLPPSDLLTRLLKTGARINAFSTDAPHLQEIFVRVAGEEQP